MCVCIYIYVICVCVSVPSCQPPQKRRCVLQKRESRQMQGPTCAVKMNAEKYWTSRYTNLAPDNGVEKNVEKTTMTIVFFHHRHRDHHQQHHHHHPTIIIIIIIIIIQPSFTCISPQFDDVYPPVPSIVSQNATIGSMRMTSHSPFIDELPICSDEKSRIFPSSLYEITRG